jgi:hypothetical protein
VISDIGAFGRDVVKIGMTCGLEPMDRRSTKTFAVHPTKPTKRAVPAMSVRVPNLADAQAVAEAARAASAAPRLDVI